MDATEGDGIKGGITMARGSIQTLTGQPKPYLVRVEYPPDPITGKRKQRSKAFRTKKEADAELTKWLGEIDRGVAVDPSKMTFGEYLRHWLATYATHNTRETTYRGYEVCVRCHIVPVLGGIALQKLTPAHLHGFYMQAVNGARADRRPGTLSAHSVRLAHSVIREALQHAFEMNMVPRNVADATKPPRAVRPQVKVWDAEDARAFLDAADDDAFAPLWLMALVTGMRRGELIGLRWQDVDLQRAVLHVRHTLMVVKGERGLREPKTKSGRRTIALSPACVAALKEHRIRQNARRLRMGADWHDRDAVFAAANGEWIDPGNLSRHFSRIVKRAELPMIRFHDLRHTSATLLLKEGVNVKVVSERLGHANISITLDTYSHVLPSMQQDAADRMDTALFG